MVYRKKHYIDNLEDPTGPKILLENPEIGSKVRIDGVTYRVCRQYKSEDKITLKATDFNTSELYRKMKSTMKMIKRFPKEFNHVDVDFANDILPKLLKNSD